VGAYLQAATRIVRGENQIRMVMKIRMDNENREFSSESSERVYTLLSQENPVKERRIFAFKTPRPFVSRKDHTCASRE
jgi:hypothetical protein